MEESSGAELVNYHLAPGEVILICPYDPSHKVRKTRMLIHLGKCRAKYTKEMEAKGEAVDFFTCKYNAYHHIRGPELLRHQQECPDRGRAFTRQGQLPSFGYPAMTSVNLTSSMSNTLQ